MKSRMMRYALLTTMLLSILIIPAHAEESLHASITATNDPANRISFNAYVDNNDVLWMWGRNEHGQLGNGTQVDSDTPVKVMGNVASVATGKTCSFAIKTDGSLWSWGANDYGILGNGGTGDKAYGADATLKIQTTPTKILDDVQMISFRNNVAAAVKKDGTLWVWGYNVLGSLGDPSFVNSTYDGSDVQSIPAKLMDHVVSVSVDTHFSAAVKDDGSLWMWGWGYAGCLGVGGWTDSEYPVKILDGVMSASVADNYGNSYSAAIKNDSTLWMWGSNRVGQLGNGGRGTGRYCDGKFVYQGTPTEVMNGVRVVKSEVGHSVAIKTDDSLWAWGDEKDGKTTSHSTPSMAMEQVSSVFINESHTVAIKKDGSCWYWDNIDAQPVKIADNALCANVRGAIVALQDGTLWKWKYNSSKNSIDLTQMLLSPNTSSDNDEHSQQDSSRGSGGDNNYFINAANKVVYQSDFASVYRMERTKTDSKGTLVVGVYYDLPMLNGNSPTITTINQKLKAKCETYINESSVFEIFDSGKPEWFSSLPLYDRVETKIQYHDSNIVSLSHYSDSYLGGASNSYAYYGETYDLQSGKLLTVADAFRGQSISVADVRTAVLSYIRNKNGDVEFAKEHFDYQIKSLSDLEYYISSDGELIVCFSKHSSIGSFFEIPSGIYINTDTHGQQNQNHASGNNIKISIDGRFVDFGDETGYPYVENGQLMMPIRVCAEAFGATYRFEDRSGGIAYITKNSESVEIKIDYSKIRFVSDNGDKTVFTTNTPAVIRSGVAYAPLKPVFECFGMNVKWINGENTVYVENKESHRLTYVAASEAQNASTPGNIEYWHCDTCDKYYADSKATQEITLSQTRLQFSQERKDLYTGRPFTSKVVNYALYTDIVAKINGHPLRSYNIDGYTAVVAEDLRGYGFNVQWNGRQRTLCILRQMQSGVPVIPARWATYTPEELTHRVGDRAKKVLSTDIGTYINGKYVKSFNIDGETLVWMDNLDVFGSIHWDEKSRVIELTLSQEATSTPITESKPVDIHVQFTHKEDGIKEYAIITGVDSAGKTIWTHNTLHYDCTELQRIEEIGTFQDTYYYNEAGTVIALNLKSGVVLWENTEFDGASIHSLIGSDGTIYLCGYYGPGFCAIDKTGKTLCRINPYGYDWAFEIKRVNDNVLVISFAGPAYEADNRGENVDWEHPEKYYGYVYIRITDFKYATSLKEL